ncbi:MAG: alpha-L-fucosidase [Acutalibacteraceae bacterium]
MIIKKIIAFFMSVIAMLSGLCSPDENNKTESGIVDSILTGGPFEVNNLDTYSVPEWFRDAKFGIFIHYGIYSVPAYGDEWYGHWMYIDNTSAYGGSDIYQHHLDTYGGASAFGYKDFIPEFNENLKVYKQNDTAENWAELFSNAGAKYVMPVGIHHDSFALYNSDIQKTYNSVTQTGIDYVGDLQKACKDRDIKFGISNHFAENDWFFDDVAGAGTDLSEKNADGTLVYGELYGDGESKSEAHIHKWYDISMEIIEKYNPDIIYYDFDLVNDVFNKYADANRYLMLAEYYNHALENNPDGVVCCNKHEAFSQAQALLDKERSSLNSINPTPWQTDTSVGKKSWGYTTDDIYRSGEDFIGLLVDIVSKNGNLLLNVGPKADGTIPAEVEATLLTIGNWLKKYGDAIYATRPWLVSGEGPTNVTTDDFTYQSSDIRFTRSKDNSKLYITALAAPESDKLTVKTFAKGKWNASTVEKVCLINGSERKQLSYQQTADGLEVNISNEALNSAYSLEITFSDGKIPSVAIDATNTIQPFDSFNTDGITYGTSTVNGSYTAINEKDGAYFDMKLGFSKKVGTASFSVSSNSEGSIEVVNLQNGSSLGKAEIKKTDGKYRDVTLNIDSPNLNGDVDIRIIMNGNVEIDSFNFIQKREPNTEIDASKYDRKQGNVRAEATSDTGGGESLGYVSSGDWVMYKDVDFGKGCNEIILRAGADNKKVNIYIDNMNVFTKVASGKISTGGYNNYEDIALSMRRTFGVHDVYIEFVDDAANLNWFMIK